MSLFLTETMVSVRPSRQDSLVRRKSCFLSAQVLLSKSKKAM